MKRRLFVKNLSALLSLPLVAKADQYAPKIGKKVTRGGVEPEPVKEKEVIKDIEPIKYIGDNVMVIRSEGGELKLYLSEISLFNDYEYIDVIDFDDNSGFIQHEPAKYSSSVYISGFIISSNIVNLNDLVNFTVFSSKDHFLEGSGVFISYGFGVDCDQPLLFEGVIEISGEILSTYEGIIP